MEARRKEEESSRVAAEKRLAQTITVKLKQVLGRTFIRSNSLPSRFEREAAAVTAHLKVKALQHSLDQSVQTCNQLRKVGSSVEKQTDFIPCHYKGNMLSGVYPCFCRILKPLKSTATTCLLRKKS